MDITHTLNLSQPWYRRLTALDWLFAAVVIAATGYAFSRFAPLLDVYEKGILLMVAPALIALGWYWGSVRWLMAVIGGLTLLSITLYDGQLANGDTAFWLKYLLSSQRAIMWMSVLFMLALPVAWGALISRSEFGSQFASGLTWAAIIAGFTGLLVRWHVSYLISPDVGHIPVSNLYEVFVLFCLIAALLTQFYAERFQSRQILPFSLVMICAAVGFLTWYAADRGAQQIQPLIPALQSYWMKIHVPANFIGSGAFSLAAAVGAAWLLAHTRMKAWLPPAALLDEIMYKAVAIGFFFFTIATILGALWAAEAWGGYWSWDPKETWALIVWLNYAAWLHLRLVKGVRGSVLAWWAVVGLLVTSFAFLGVNMWLTGLHSYGGL